MRLTELWWLVGGCFVLWLASREVGSWKRRATGRKCKSAQVQVWCRGIPDGKTGVNKIPNHAEAWVDFRLMQLLLKVHGRSYVFLPSEEEEEAYPDAFGDKSGKTHKPKEWMAQYDVRRFDGPRWEVRDFWTGEWLPVPFDEQQLESAYQVFTHSFRPLTSEDLAVLSEFPWMLWPWLVLVDKKPAAPGTEAPDGFWEAVRRRRGEMRKSE